MGDVEQVEHDVAVAPAGAAGGDPARDAAETALFKQHYEPLVRLAYVLTSDAEFAHEAVQDAFLAVHRRWARIENPAGYLRTAVVNVCNSFHRRRAVARRNGPPAPQAVHAAYDELSDALGKLSAERRAVLALRFYRARPPRRREPGALARHRGERRRRGRRGDDRRPRPRW